MKIAFYFYFLLLFHTVFSFAQTPTQNLRGKVLDKETQQPIPAVSVIISPLNKGTTTDN